MSEDSNRQFDLIAWRRAQVLEHLATGKTHQQIADILHVSRPTITQDIGHIRQQIKEKQSQYLEDEIPYRHTLRTAGMDKAIKELWALFEKETDSRQKKGILDSLTDAYIKQASIDGDPVAINSALKKIARVRKRLEESTQSDTDSYDSGNLYRGPARRITGDRLEYG
jgi:hypothetical protein